MCEPDQYCCYCCTSSPFPSTHLLHSYCPKHAYHLDRTDTIRRCKSYLLHTQSHPASRHLYRFVVFGHCIVLRHFCSCHSWFLPNYRTQSNSWKEIPIHHRSMCSPDRYCCCYCCMLYLFRNTHPLHSYCPKHACHLNRTDTNRRCRFDSKNTQSHSASRHLCRSVVFGHCIALRHPCSCRSWFLPNYKIHWNS